MTDNEFFERLRRDAAPLRHQPDDTALARIRARIQERIAPQPTVLDLLAAWFRPVVTTMAALAIAAGIGIATSNASNDAGGYDDAIEIVMAGETYSVGR